MSRNSYNVYNVSQFFRYLNLRAALNTIRPVRNQGSTACVYTMTLHPIESQRPQVEELKLDVSL